MEMEQIKSGVTTAFQQVQLYNNLTYFKKDKPSEKELMQEKLQTALDNMNSNMDALGLLCEKVDNPTILEAYDTWNVALDSYTKYVNEVLKYAKAEDFESVFALVDVQNVNKEPAQTAEDAYEELVVLEQQNILNASESRINGAIVQSIVYIVLCIVIFLIAVVIINFTIVLPAKKSGSVLQEIVEKLQKNEGDLTERIPVKTSDEIGQMTIGINNFMEQLQALMQKLKVESENMRLSAETIMAKANQSDEDASSVSAAMEEMSASMQEMAATLDSIVTGIDRVSKEVVHVGQEVDNGVGLVDDIKQRAEKMHHNTIESKNTTNQILQDIRIELVGAVESSRSVEKIQDLTGQIMDIASQTNLLSLNASIEAARAGEAGRGFAVVADEIRSLADDSRDTASNIQQISELVIGAVGKLSANAEKMLEFVDEQVLKDYDGFAEIVEQYRSDAESVNSILRGIAENTNKINETMSEMNTGINDISIAVDESAKGIVEVAENAVSLAGEIRSIRMETEKNQEISISLSNEVKRFKKV